jgi:hypothetical protein
LDFNMMCSEVVTWGWTARVGPLFPLRAFKRAPERPLHPFQWLLQVASLLL